MEFESRHELEEWVDRTLAATDLGIYAVFNSMIDWNHEQEAKWQQACPGVDTVPQVNGRTNGHQNETGEYTTNFSDE